jgi:cell wall-associated NlpC family hydrolase
MMKRLLLLGAFLIPFAGWGGVDITFTPEGPVTTKSSGSAEVAAPPSAPMEGLILVPVADLRRTPERISPQAVRSRPYVVDDNQETQLLFGERIQIFEVKGNWVRVEAVDQAEWTHGKRWQGYPGWVLKEAVMGHPPDFFPSAVVIARYGHVRQTQKRRSSFMELPMGSRIGVLYTQKGWVRVQGPQGEMGWMRDHELRLDREAPTRSVEVRAALMAAAREFIGEPYYWGGRTGHRKKGTNPSGLDCSGLVNVAYRTVALNAPRDAHEQFMMARALKKGVDLRPGDLVFLAKKGTPDRIVHVMFYEKNETVIEAVHEFNKVRRVSFKKKLGVRQNDLHSGAVVGEFVVHLGTFLDK